MRIAKAKIKEGQLHVVRETTDGDVDEKSFMHSLEGYHPDLAAAFVALTPWVRKILEWPEDQYEGDLNVTGVAWTRNEKSGIEGAVITCHAVLKETKRAFNFNTPYLPFEPYGEAKNQPLMPEDAITALANLRGEVQRFLDGKRSQGDLFPGNDNEDDEQAA